MNDKIKQAIISHFPYAEFNPGQFDAIYRSVIAIMDKKEHVILSCPTGVGKSVIAITIHNVLDEVYRKNQTSIVLSTTKGLQDQYNKDFPALVDLKGKTNYYCHWNIFEGYNSQKCVEKVMSQECSADRCPYVTARQAWQAHKGCKTTNSSLLIASPMIIPVDEPADLCIIDECHEIDKVLISQSIIKFDVDEYPSTEKYYKDFKNEYLKFINAFKTYVPTNDSFLVAECMLADDQLTLYQFQHIVSEAYKKVTTGLSSAQKKDYKFVLIERELQELTDKLKYFVEAAYCNTEWVMDIVDGTIVITPIRSSGIMADEKLFRKARQFIHMSATIGGIETYCKNLGLVQSDIEYIVIDNPIPIESRKVYLNNLTKINRFTDTSDIIKAIVPIINSNTGNGIIHTVSFKLANDIYNAAPSSIKRRMLVSNNRKEILATLASSHNSIILSPSVETGYDFKGDLARWQIIAKVPFLNLGDNYVNVRKNKNNDWYTREAVLRLIQACGRIVRGLDDYGSTYIIDENVLRLISSNTEMFPEWWLNALEMN